jgi:hypothetical protein
VQKYYLRIVCFVITLALGAAAAKIHKSSVFRPTISQTSQVVVTNEVTAETPWRCDATPELPHPIKVLLDRNFPGWQFPAVSEDDCQSVKSWGGRDALAQLIQGDFDGDSRLDYAVLIESESGTDDRGLVSRPTIYIVAFLAKPNGFKMRIVTHDGGGCLQLMRKGDGDYDYDAQRKFTYSQDTIFSGMGMGGSSYLYEHGKFRGSVTGD